MKHIQWVFLLAIVLVTARAEDIKDAEWEKLLDRHSKSVTNGQCHVHQTKMEKKPVPIQWGLPGPPGEGEPTIVERFKLFPFAQEFTNGGCCPIVGKTTENIYICKDCKISESKWIKEKKKSEPYR